MRIPLFLIATAASLRADPIPHPAEQLLFAESGSAKVGIHIGKGASITHLSWKGYAKNAVNAYDPGRLIQQSYYAGRLVDRRTEGQHEAWSPWAWNPIQGGGVGSWSHVIASKILVGGTLLSETVPRLWDMPGEEAAAVMRQWTGFESGMPGVVAVSCELECRREPGDRWGPALPRHQEVPAAYFTRNFDTFKTFLGDGRWRVLKAKVGPPWNQSGTAPRGAMACFEKGGQGIAVFSPGAEFWNFGPVGKAGTDDPLAAPCVHLAPVVTAELGWRSSYRYRYWLIVGTEAAVGKQLDILWKKHRDARPETGAVAPTPDHGAPAAGKHPGSPPPGGGLPDARPR